MEYVNIYKEFSACCFFYFTFYGIQEIVLKILPYEHIQATQAKKNINYFLILTSFQDQLSSCKSTMMQSWCSRTFKENRW